MEAVTKIEGPRAPPPPSPPPSEEAQWDKASSSSETDAEQNEETRESNQIDTEEKLLRQQLSLQVFTDVTSMVPDWTNYCTAIPLLPNRASQKQDYQNLTALRDHQARYLHLLTTMKLNHWHVATKDDLETANHVLRREAHKLSLLDARLQIYNSVLQKVTEVAFNEFRGANDHSSKNDNRSMRTNVTFRQAKMLIDNISKYQIEKKTTH